MSVEQSQSSQRSRRQAALLTAAAGWMPLSPGFNLRKLLYRSIFAHLGEGVYIEPGVELINPGGIEIGDHVKLVRGVRLDSQGNNSRIRIGNGVQFAGGVGIKVSRDDCLIEIGDQTSIGPSTFIHGPGAINIGQDCLIAAHCGIYAASHQFADPTRKIREQGLTHKGIVIGNDCWIGHGVTVLDGITIGEGSVIGAGSVVNKNIPPYSIAVGVPAKVISQRGRAAVISKPD